MIFPVSYDEILNIVNKINPIEYGKNRNFINGAVSYISPYISRGVISTKQVFETVVKNGFEPSQIETFLKELAWRDYWQLQWQINGAKINFDLKNTQPNGRYSGIPQNLLHHQTGIAAIDSGIEKLYETGYMHNHLRMYVASLACNVAKCKWEIPAKWMYYHLLDADWGSNALSWQWVCGSNSQKLYYANQANINHYCETQQHNTFLDVEYYDFPEMQIPTALEKLSKPDFTTPLPQTNMPEFAPELPIHIYNFYNIDPKWRSDEPANRVLLLEPSVFQQHPVSQKSIDFCIQLAKSLIPNIQIWAAEFETLKKHFKQPVVFREHPLNNYRGTEDQREWMSQVRGAFPPFFAFWKQCKKQLI